MNKLPVSGTLRPASLVAICVFLCLWLVSFGLHGAIVANESFETCTIGPLAGQGGGTGWTGSWTAPGSSVVRAEVADTAGNPLAFTPAGGTRIDGASRAFEVQLAGAASSQLCGVRTLAAPIAQTFYVGYLVRHQAGASWAGANNTFTLHLGTNTTQAAVLNFGIRGDAGGTGTNHEFVIRFGTAGPVAGASTGGQLSSGVDYFLVARVNFSGGAFTSANLWVNPAGNEEIAVPNGHAMLTGFTSPPITHLFFREAVLDADDVLRADELRLGTTFADVVSPEPVPPTVTLTQPANGASFSSPATIPLQATASATGGPVTNLAFFAGATLLAQVPAEPYVFSWTNVPAGQYTLTAMATDHRGATGTSAPVMISVTNPAQPTQLIAEDSFSYLSSGGGSLHGKNGGNGWAAPWVTNNLGNAATIADATGQELRYTPVGGATIDGGAEVVDVTGIVNQPVAYRQLAAPLTEPFYVAYLLRLAAGTWSGTHTFSVHLADAGGNTGTLNFGARAGAGADFMVRLGTGAPNGTNVIATALTPNSTWCLVARLSKPAGSDRFDRIEMWLNPAYADGQAPDLAYTLPAGTGLPAVSHLILRAAAMSSETVVRLDELKVGSTWEDVLAPWTGTPAIASFSLLDAATGQPVPGYDPLTNNAGINLFLTGTNLAVRANSSPSFDFGSVALNLTGATTAARTDNTDPWSLFGDTNGLFAPGAFNLGPHSLTATPWTNDAATGEPGIPAALNFTVFNTVIVTNRWPNVALTHPANAATFTAPATITLAVAASDSDGAITNVEFFAGSTKIGGTPTPPYLFLWTNVTAGAYSLSARATDNDGALGISAPVLISVLSTNTNGVVSGELKKWHRVSITWEGPDTSETNANNPFRNYRLNVTFTHPASGTSYLVPGFFAADGDAANSSADAGNRWRVHFTPDHTGTWHFLPSFRAGTDVALSADPNAGLPSHFDAAGGSFLIAPTDKSGRDLRAKGRLQYVGKHHLRFAESGEFFLKMGADSPENLLSYDDFDDQPNVANLRKSWAPHAPDFDPADAADYTWAGGKGSELLGAIKYLADEGLNAFSFIPFTLDGDDKNVFPHRLVGSVAAFQSAAQPRWTKSVVFQDRFDISRMDQWDRIFSYGDKLGMYLHFKTLETENELTMDGGNLGPQRILYYRELIARFGYHLALNWNLGEEINDASTAQKQAWSQFFYDHDPYRHLQVIHNGASHYDLLGPASRLTGFSKQTGPGGIFAATLDYLKRSAEAGVPWVVAFDEQNPADVGVMPDISTLFSQTNLWHDDIRGQAIWSHLLAGGAGCEFYFGYRYEEDDLECQNLRSRDRWWDQCRHALEFFQLNAVPFWNMTNRNSLLSGLSGTYCFALTGQVYVAYLPTNGLTSLNLAGAPGQFTVRWFDPRHGGALQTGSVSEVTGGGNVSLGAAPLTSTNDWVVLVRTKPLPPAPTLNLVPAPVPGHWQVEWSATGLQLYKAPWVMGPWAPVEPAPASPYLLSTTNPAEFYQLRYP